MTTDLLQGKLVSLEAIDDKAMAEAISRWSRDSEYLRMLDTGPALTFSVKFQ